MHIVKKRYVYGFIKNTILWEKLYTYVFDYILRSIIGWLGDGRSILGDGHLQPYGWDI